MGVGGDGAEAGGEVADGVEDEALAQRSTRREGSCRWVGIRWVGVGGWAGVVWVSVADGCGRVGCWPGRGYCA